MNPVIDHFVEEAKATNISDCLSLLHLPAPKGGQAEYMGPCPVSGGKDRFSFNTRKNVWNCRGCGEGGRGAIGLAGHVLGINLKTREGYLAACSAVLGRPVPDESLQETAEQKKAREEKAAEKLKQAKKLEEQRQKQAAYYRAKERQKAVEKWQKGRFLSRTRYNDYIARRCGEALSVWPLRIIDNEPYFLGTQKIYSGPAMVAPFVAETGEIIGCHLTWIDLDNPPKYRPDLVNEAGEKLPTKKMRGSKKGGVIPLRGFVFRHGCFSAAPDRKRMVIGEGIENVLAICLAEGERKDTIYAAAGDLGNLTGPADPASRFQHPNLDNIGKDGRRRPVFVAGPVPLIHEREKESIWVPEQISELVLIGDSDSEPVMTASAMARAKARFSKTGRTIPVVWPPRGLDVADMMVADITERRVQNG